MLVLLHKYKILTNRGGGVVAGNFITVSVDDTTFALEVRKFNNAADLVGSVMVSGPDIGSSRRDHDIIQNTGYTYCSGTTLKKYGAYSVFPYTFITDYPNHFSCTPNVVCDLVISDSYTVDNASDFVTANGRIVVTATSSNGPVKYSLNPNFDYNTSGQLSGEFVGLFAGDYTVTAKDSKGCFSQKNITISVPDTYGTLHRLDYKDVNGIKSRLDILERGYSGAITEILGSEEPVVIKYNADGEINKFYSIVPSELQATLMATSANQFNGLFSQDERKYKVQFYKDFGNTLPGFTPAAMPALSTWTNVSGLGTAWTTGATPNVLMTSSQSQRIGTNYTFVAGRTYTFNFNFAVTVVASPSAEIRIEITNSSGADLGVHKFLAVPTSGSYTSGHTFVAPVGADRVRVYCIGAGNFMQVQMNTFTADTTTQPGTPKGYELKWQGYLISSNLQQQYTKAPYPITVSATDGLADLKTYDWVNDDGNNFFEDITPMQAISKILKKTDLLTNIQVAVNRYENAMAQTAADDPFTQCKFNPFTFIGTDAEPEKCDVVLREILKPFGARICQRDGQWFIASIEEMVTTMEYREFNYLGQYVTNGTFDDVVSLTSPITPGVLIENETGSIEMLPSYRNFYFEHTLVKNPSLLKSYSFEPENLLTDPDDGSQTIDGWNVNISGNNGATYGVKETKAFEGKTNFFLKFPVVRGGGTNLANGVVLLSQSFPIEYTGADAFEFRFNYSALLATGSFGNVYWVKIKWMLKVGSYFFNEVGGWTTDVNQKYNDVIVDRFNENLEKKVVAAMRDILDTQTETAQIEFILNNAFVYDYASNTALKAVPTTTLPIGSKVKVNASTTTMNLYTLEEGTDAESIPNVIRPTDYAATTNERIWRANNIGVSSRGRYVEYIYLDNVVLLHFPNSAEPPENITLEKANNPGIKIDFEEKYLLNDIDTVNINNSERTYVNFFKLMDGTPTATWQRTYRSGSGKLLELLSDDVVSQYKANSAKLTGSFYNETDVRFTSVLNEPTSNNTKYLFMGYSLSDKICSIEFDVLEIKDVVTDPDSPSIDAGFTTGFTLGFRS